MSKELKIGDQVQINAVDDVTADYYPDVLGSHVTIVDFSDLGNALFDYTNINEDCPYGRFDTKHLAIQESHGWRFELL